MAKTKTSSKQKPMNVKVDGKTYFCRKKREKVTVREDRTAQGQNLLSGVLDLKTGEWHNDSGHLSTKVKKVIAELYIDRT